MFSYHYIYEGGLDSSTVGFYKISSGGHQVPSKAVTQDEYGLGNRNRDFKASKVIWEFFRKYSLTTLTTTPASACLPASVGIDDVISENTISIYPNPSNGIFYIELKSNSNATLTISNVLGVTVLEKKIAGSIETIDLSAAPAGVYFYQVVSPSGSIKSGKLIVE